MYSILQLSWIDPGQYMSRFIYISYNNTDFDEFGKMFNFHVNNSTGFDKPNMTVNAHPESREWPYIMTTAYANKGK